MKKTFTFACLGAAALAVSGCSIPTYDTASPEPVQLRAPAPAAAPAAAAKPAAPAVPGIRLTSRPGRVVLEGAGVDAAFAKKLQAWLDGR